LIKIYYESLNRRISLKPTAYCLISGGLDSVLAIRLLQEQDINVIGVHFTSPFFDKSATVREIARDLDIEVKIIEIGQEHLEIIENPVYGYGKNMNPCIDCHAFMFKKAGELIDPKKKEFLATGEVLNQRPMSQNLNSLNTVARHSGLHGYIIRPLSALELEPSVPEQEGWVDRSKLLGITGRHRKKQLELVEKWNLPIHTWPAGGCLLTDPTFSRKIEKLKNKGKFKLHFLHAMTAGRIMEIGEDKFLVVARNQKECQKLDSMESTWKLSQTDTPGPVILGWGSFNQEDLNLMGEIFNFYSKSKGKNEVRVIINKEERKAGPVNREILGKLIREAIL
jgi:tRNA-specific 2-thiouridylase